MANITGQHWLYDWIDEFEISDRESLRTRWRSQEARSRFISLLLEPITDFSSVPASGIVVAGIGLNLSSKLVCEQAGCRATIANTVYPEVLHYFDCALMEGPSAARYRTIVLNSRGPEEVLEMLEQDVALMLYLRKIGLADYIVFAKGISDYCKECTHRYASEMGLGDLIEEERLVAIAKALSRQGRVRIVQNGPREWWGGLEHPQFDEIVGQVYEQKTRPKKLEVALTCIRHNLAELVSDAATANFLQVPLASLGKPSFFSTEEAGDSLTVDEVALRVRIPVLQGLTTEEFLKLREREYQHFAAFRSLLQQSIEETIQEAKTESPDRAAELVWRRKIQPQVVDLERKIAASRRSAARKVIAGVTVGAASAAIGSMAGAVTATLGSGLGTGIGAALGTVAALPTVMPSVAKFFEDRQAIETSNAYFLWKAAKLPHQHLT